MKFKKNKQKIFAVLAISVALILPNSYSLVKSAKPSSAEILQDWYENYSTTENISENRYDSNNNGITVQQSSYRAGRGIRVVLTRTKTNVTTAQVSVGYRARKKLPSGRYLEGFVTCAHDVKRAKDGKVYGNKTDAKNNVNVLGTRYNYMYSGTIGIDASFVVLASGNSMKRETKDGVSLSSSIKKVKAGDKVTMCGTISDTVTREVKEVNPFLPASIYDKEKCEYVWFDNLIKTDSLGTEGDSGAVVYTYSGGKNKIVGINIAGDDRYSYIVPAKTINKQLGLETY